MFKQSLPIARNSSAACLICGLLIAIHLGASLKAEEVTIKQFRSQAPQAWKDLKAGILKGFKVRSTRSWGQPSEVPGEVISGGPDGGAESKTYCLWKGNEVIQTNSLDSSQVKERVEAVNDRYGFVLSKVDQPRATWEIDDLRWDPAARKDQRYGILKGSSGVFDCLMVEGDWLANLIESPSFEVVSTENVTSDTAQEFKIVFRSQHSVDRANTILGGSLWLDPQRYWVLRRYEVEIKSITFGRDWVEKKTTLGRATAKFEYQDLEGYPFLKDSLMDYQFEGDPPIRYRSLFEPVARFKGDESEFTLSAFGFAEPAPIDGSTWSSARKWWLAISILGILFCVTALLLRRRQN